MGKRVAVTGAAGYIGSRLVPHLVERGHEVVSFDTGFFTECYVAPELREVSSDFIKKDVREIVASDFDAFDTVIHLAGLSNDPLGDINSSLTEDINSRGTINVAHSAKAAGVGHFIFASSCSVYGGGAGDRILTELDPADPLTQYASSKLDGEKYLSQLEDENFRTTSLRAATVFGFAPRLRLDLVINELTAQAVVGRPITLNSQGNAWRPFVHVEDLSSVYSTVLEGAPQDFNHSVYNVGTESTTSTILEIANLISAATGVEVKIADGASPDSRNYRVSFDRFSEDFPAWTPKFDTEAGVNDLVENLQNNKFTEAALSDSSFRRLPRILEQIDAGYLNTDLYWIR
jgi:nucleoside-diphosphate-sugar epimerase